MQSEALNVEVVLWLLLLIAVAFEGRVGDRATLQAFHCSAGYVQLLDRGPSRNGSIVAVLYAITGWREQVSCD